MSLISSPLTGFAMNVVAPELFFWADNANAISMNGTFFSSFRFAHLAFKSSFDALKVMKCELDVTFRDSHETIQGNKARHAQGLARHTTEQLTLVNLGSFIFSAMKQFRPEVPFGVDFVGPFEGATSG